ncbi:MAG: NUDIX domain-containing protein [Chloroflexi bacterium]|nr:NUDIX domain-containing protein [Chloroflexota bacterium]
MPTFGVNVAIIQDGQILLTQRSDLPVWCLPGGAVDDGESLAQAAIREAREETGLDVELVRLVGVYSRPNWRRGGDHSTLFAARPVGGELQPVTNETLDAGYFKLNELPDTLLWYHHQRILDACSQMVGIARLQDTVWPLDDDTIAIGEIRNLIDQGSVSMQDLFEQLCGQRRPEQEKLEVEGTVR